MLDRLPPGPAREALHAAVATVAALIELPAALHQVSSADLATTVEVLGELVDRAQAAIVMATAEADQRGTIKDSRAASGAQWVATHGGRLEPGEAARVATVAKAVNDPTNALLREAVATGQCSARGAQVTLRELDKIMPSLPDFARDEAMAYFLQVADFGTTKQLRHLSRWLLATYADDQLERDEAALERAEEMRWYDLPGGLRRFTLDLGPINAARLTSAVQALAGPQPVTDPDTGETTPDPRTAGKRRADALMDLIGVATSADTSRAHGSTTKLILTMGLEHLLTGLGARPTLNLTGLGEDDLSNGGFSDLTDGAFSDIGFSGFSDVDFSDGVELGGLGTTSNDDQISSGAVRRLACDADIIPMVLGSRSEPLDVGREQRLVKDGLRTAVVTRDRHCTFPGCDRPPGFCEVHHVLAWYLGGETSLLNSALLCDRHHTIVHRDQLTAVVTPFRVQWQRADRTAA